MNKLLRIAEFGIKFVPSFTNLKSVAMKKICIILLIIAAGFTACEGPMGPEGPRGEDAYLNWKTVNFTIYENHWDLIGSSNQPGSYYSVLLDLPELTNAIYDNGVIVCYYEYRDELGDLVLSPLPYTLYEMYNDDRGREVQASTHYSYTLSPGSIEFRLAYSDFYTGDYPPPAKCFFRVSIVY
jgi:hypothetical protein